MAEMLLTAVLKFSPIVHGAFVCVYMCVNFVKFPNNCRRRALYMPAHAGKPERYDIHDRNLITFTISLRSHCDIEPQHRH